MPLGKSEERPGDESSTIPANLTHLGPVAQRTARAQGETLERTDTEPI